MLPAPGNLTQLPILGTSPLHLRAEPCGSLAGLGAEACVPSSLPEGTELAVGTVPF